MKILKWPAFFTAAAVAVALLVTHGCAGSGEKQDPIGDLMARQIRLMREAAEEVIGEADRREKLIALIDRLGLVLEQHVSDFNDHAVEFQSLFTDYDTDNATLHEALETYVANRDSHRERVLELHFEMVALTTAEEWRAIVDKELSSVAEGTLIPSPAEEG